MEVIEKVEGRNTVIVLEDENGEQFKQLLVDDVIFPMIFMNREPEKRFSYVKNFPYVDGDVLLCSFPKTGTHWAANLLHFLMHDGPLDDMVSYSPCLVDMFDMEESQQREGKRIITSHFTPKRLPTEHFAKGGKTILMFRNPKDTAVSLFCMLRRQKMSGEFKLSWNSFLNYWLEGKTVGGSYFNYYNSWQQMMQTNPERDILIVQFEDLKTDSINQLRRIQDYLGLKHSDDRLKEVLDKCSLGSLKADVDSGKIKSKLTDESGKSILYRKEPTETEKHLRLRYICVYVCQACRLASEDKLHCRRYARSPKASGARSNGRKSFIADPNKTYETFPTEKTF